jgi:DNA-binding transcriptional MerR regulator
MAPEVMIPERSDFKIGEVCDIAGVKPFVLRYWETEFPELTPTKGAGGQRSYSRADVELILRIKHLLYEERFTVAGAKKRLAEEQGIPVAPEPVAEEQAAPIDSTPAVEVERLRQAIAEARDELQAIVDLLK